MNLEQQIEKDIQLEELVDNGDRREVKRALAVKMFLLGAPRSFISLALNVSEAFVSKWNGIYRREGSENLKLGYVGSQSYLNEEEKLEIIEYIKTQEVITLESLVSYIDEKYGVVYASKQSYYDMLHVGRKSWKKTEKTNPKGNPEEVQKKRMEIAAELLKNEEDIKSGKLVVFFEDECHLVWKDILGYAWGNKNKPTKVPIINERERQSYYGVINYLTHEVIVKEYSAGDGKNTVDFIKQLRNTLEDSRLLFIWDGASYHKYGETREYLKEINQDLEEQDWLVKCILFAPNAPEQNPMEDVWLQGKSFLRKNFYKLKKFGDVKSTFLSFFNNKSFDFKKLYFI